jgi:hypothetical protein
VAIGVDGALTAAEERKALGREGLQRRLLDLDKVGPDLSAGRAVNAQPGDRPIPLPQEGVVRVEAVEAPAFQRVGFDIAATALLLPVFLWGPRPDREGREAPVRGEGQIDVVAIGIVEAGADVRRTQMPVCRKALRDCPPMGR